MNTIPTCKTQEELGEISAEICATDNLIAEMVDSAADNEISWSVLVSRMLTHGIVGLHHLLQEEREGITDGEIKKELLESTAMIYELFLAQKEMASPRILH